MWEVEARTMPGQKRTVFEVRYTDNATGTRCRELWWMRRWAEARAAELAGVGVVPRLRTTRMDETPTAGAVLFRRVGERRRHA